MAKCIRKEITKMVEMLVAPYASHPKSLLLAPDGFTQLSEKFEIVSYGNVGI